MPKIVLSIDEKILSASRAYAKRRSLTLDELIIQMLQQRIGQPENLWLDECFSSMDTGGAESTTGPWTRDDAYDR